MRPWWLFVRAHPPSRGLLKLLLPHAAIPTLLEHTYAGKGGTDIKTTRPRQRVMGRGNLLLASHPASRKQEASSKKPTSILVTRHELLW